MSEITEQTRVPFGRKPDKGKKLCECSTKFLQWISDMLWDTDRHEFAFHAREILKKRSSDEAEVASELDLELQADAFLRNHGCKHLCPRRRIRR